MIFAFIFSTNRRQKWWKTIDGQKTNAIFVAKSVYGRTPTGDLHLTLQMAQRCSYASDSTQPPWGVKQHFAQETAFPPSANHPLKQTERKALSNCQTKMVTSFESAQLTGNNWLTRLTYFLRANKCAIQGISCASFNAKSIRRLGSSKKAPTIGRAGPIHGKVSLKWPNLVVCCY